MPPYASQLFPLHLTRAGCPWDTSRLLLTPRKCSQREEKYRGSVGVLAKALPRHAQLLALGDLTTLHLLLQPGQRVAKGNRDGMRQSRKNQLKGEKERGKPSLKKKTLFKEEKWVKSKIRRKKKKDHH